MAHVGCHWKAWYVVEEFLIDSRPAPRGERPDDRFERVHVHVFAHEDEFVDEHAAFAVEEMVSQHTTKVRSRYVQIAECIRVDLESTPCSVALERYTRSDHREVKLFAEAQYLD